MVIKSLVELDQWVFEPGQVRLYQHLILHERQFSVEIENRIYKYISCTTDDVLIDGEHIYPGLSNRLLLQRVDTGNYYILASYGVAGGFLLVEGKPSAQIMEIPSECVSKWCTKKAKPFVVAGFGQFGHFIWNNLPAMLSYPDKNIDVVQRMNHRIIKLSSLDNFTDIEPTRERPCLILGSIYVTEQTRLTLHKYHDIIDPPGSDENVISLGIRGLRYRGITNEYEFYCELLKHINNLNIPVTVLIDGMTTNTCIDPENIYHGWLNPLAPHTIARATLRKDPNVGKKDDIHDMTIKLLDVIGKKYKNIVAINIHGMDFAEWYPVANKTTYYVTHIGTMQHKYGWYLDKPGYVLGRNAPAFSNWLPKHGHSKHPQPVFSLRTYFKSIQSKDSPLPSRPKWVYRNSPMELTNLSAVVQQCMTDMKKYIKKAVTSTASDNCS